MGVIAEQGWGTMKIVGFTAATIAPCATIFCACLYKANKAKDDSTDGHDPEQNFKGGRGPECGMIPGEEEYLEQLEALDKPQMPAAPAYVPPSVQSPVSGRAPIGLGMQPSESQGTSSMTVMLIAAGVLVPCIVGVCLFLLNSKKSSRARKRPGGTRGSLNRAER